MKKNQRDQLFPSSTRSQSTAFKRNFGQGLNTDKNLSFYFANDAEKTLHLKAFAGIPTDHTVIPFGKGICGQVAISNENFVVDDVSAQDSYIACDIHVKSEIVIPLFVNDKNVGQIDIDSNVINAFSEEDAHFLEQLNAAIADLLF